MRESGLIDRGRELGVLEDALAAASRGEPQVAFVEGDAGFGKSSLLRAFRGAHQDVTTVTWDGDDTESHLSYAMLDQLVVVTGSWADPFTAGAALLTRLDDLAGDGPVVLALDDVHLADPSSLVAVNFAIRRLRRDPVLVLLSARCSGVSVLPASMVRISSETGRRLSLGGLTSSGIQDLAVSLGVGPLSPRAANRLHALTQGNPLHLTALLTEIPTEHLERHDRPLPAPGSFAQLVLAQLGAAAPATRTVVTAAAVLGDRCSLSDLAAVTGLEADTMLSALDELARLQLLRVPAGSSTGEFEHPLVRAAVYGDLGPGTRAGLHRTAAGVLDGWASLRHRIAASAAPDADLAADLDRWSTTERTAGHLSSAAEAMLASHQSTPGGPDADRRLVAAVSLYLQVGDVRAAQAHARSVAALPISGPRLAVQAHLAWLAGSPDDAVALGQQAWTLGDLEPAERDPLAAMLAQIETLRDHADAAVTWATRALADGSLPPEATSHTRAQLALGLATAGRYDEALDSLADLPDDPDLVDLGRHHELSVRGLIALMKGERPSSLTPPDLTVAADLSLGDMQPFRLEAASAIAVSMFKAGRWDESQAVVAQVSALVEDMEQTWMLGFMHALRAVVPAARGEWATAEEHVSLALADSRASGVAAVAAYADDAAVLLATSRADHDAVVRATVRIRRAGQTSPQREPGLFSWPVHLVSALIDLGRLEDADAELALLARRSRTGGPRTKAACLRLSGQLAAARHDAVRARTDLTQALAIAEDHVDAFERALAHDAYGRFLRRRGERRAAIGQLRRAHARYTVLGAAPFAARCATELAACGVLDPGAAITEDPLTAQERTVALLICAGRTNREAAQELVLSVKTVGYHLENVYAKLGVHSRAQLVAAMRTQDPASWR